MATSPLAPRFYTRAEVCAYLNISPSTLYRLERSEAISPVKIGTLTRFSQAELDRFSEDVTADN